MSLTKNKDIWIIILIIPLLVSIVYSAIPIQVQRGDFDSTHQVTFMTYNVHFGIGMDDRVDLERILQNILLEDPDIIGLQEVENGRITSQGSDISRWLAMQLGMEYRYYPAINEHGFGVTLLSRYPIINFTTYDLPTIVWDRVMLRGTIQLNSTFYLDVFVSHLGLTNDNRTAQVQYILSQTSQVSRPKILMGDFNLWDHTPEIKNITQTFNDTTMDYNLTNPSNTDTFPSWPMPEPGRRIDYIFATDFSYLIDGHVVNDMLPGVHAAWEYGSDHFPVVATLQY